MNNLTRRVLGNRYILLEKIGQGGMALVYKAKCQLLNRYVAVKILRPEFTVDDEFVKKFKRESLAAASLSHPNIVGIYDVGEEDGIYYIVMEYVQGQTLKEYIKEKGKINYKEALRIANQIALALEHAHKNGVVHRDIKSHNILITADKIVKVTDFGIARASTAVTMTNTGTVMGSVHYFSPEQAKGGFVDHRTDIYSLGVVMYEMLTGELPYDAESPITVALKHIQESFIEPLAKDESIPRALNDIVLKAMEKEPSKRYQNATELIDSLAEAQKNPDIELYNSKEIDEKTRIIPVEEIDKALEKNKKSKKKNMVLIISMIVLFSLSIIALIVVGYNKYFLIKEVSIPKIIGIQRDEAERILKELKLNIEISEENSDKPVGEVIRVFPDEGTKIKENQTVNIVISAGQKKIKVPDIRNMDLYTAENILKRYNLKIGFVDRKNSDDIEKDLIIEQNPAPNTELSPGSEINITISDGPQYKFSKVPFLIGMTLEEAEKVLRKEKLFIGTTKYDSNSKYIDGVIIDQEIPQGTEVREGTLINITINKIEGENSGETNP